MIKRMMVMVGLEDISGSYGVIIRTRITQRQKRLVDSLMVLIILTFLYIYVAWYGYCKICGFNKTHTSSLHEAWQKEVEIFKLPPTCPFILNMNGKFCGRNKQYSVSMTTHVTTITVVEYSLTNTTCVQR